MMNTFFAIILSFGKIGLISLGGGNSMLKLLEYEAVDYRHWINQEEFVAMVGSSFIFPGLTGVKLSALIGYKAAGVTGLILAVLSLNLPGLFMALLGYKWLTSHSGPGIRKIMVGVQYGALALLAAASYSVAQGVVGMYFSIPIAVCCFIFFLALVFWNLSPFYGFLGFIVVCFFLVR
ncbi:chromate transport protein [Legionella wadsworthii]|uniref:Chromate transport protein n=1 Tax=Legionella wadsworthii TaxID=28088 RepID=A0A378LUP5_9GAMM|nr:chromate transporter [Legionella wadsworthii]STY30963.1 chromate transport protein [Legionella wadsworthii]